MAKTYNEFAVKCLNYGNTHEAMLYLTEAEKYDPNSQWIHLNLGLVHLKKNELHKASERLITCLQLDPNNEETKLRLSIVNYKQGINSFNNKKYAETIKYLTEAITYCSSSPDYFTFRARTYVKLRKLQLAREDVIRALQIDPGNKIANELKNYLN